MVRKEQRRMNRSQLEYDTKRKFPTNSCVERKNEKTRSAFIPGRKKVTFVLCMYVYIFLISKGIFHLEVGLSRMRIR